MFELKKIDFDILVELSRNSRQSFRNIAKKIGCSVSTVIKRVSLLQENGIIKEFTVSIDHHKLGYGYHALLEIETVQEKMNEVEEFLKKRKDVYAIYYVTGTKDIATLIRTKSQQELRNLLRAIAQLPSVERMETRIIFDTPKESIGYINE